MRCLVPVIFLEHHSLYTKIIPVPVEDLNYCVSLVRAQKVIEGRDITVLAYSSMEGRMITLGKVLKVRRVSFNLIDLRTLDLSGIHYGTIGESLRKTGALVII